MRQLIIKIPFGRPIITLSCSDEKLLEYIGLCMCPFASIDNNSDGTDYLLVEISLCASGYVIECNKQHFWAKNKEIVLRSVNRLIHESVLINDPFLAIHSAVLAKDTTNYLFVGATGAGKSTLAAYLSGMGFFYYSDDKALINCKTLRMYPCIKPIHLRRGGKLLLESKYGMEVEGDRFFYEEEERFRIHRQTTEFSTTRNLCVVFVDRTDRQEASIRKLTQNEALRLLVNNLIFTSDLEKQTILALQLVSSADCFSLRYNKLSEVEELLNSIAK